MLHVWKACELILRLHTPACHPDDSRLSKQLCGVSQQHVNAMQDNESDVHNLESLAGW